MDRETDRQGDWQRETERDRHRSWTSLTLQKTNMMNNMTREREKEERERERERKERERERAN